MFGCSFAVLLENLKEQQKNSRRTAEERAAMKQLLPSSEKICIFAFHPIMYGCAL
jgi:hypothetical protein